MLASDILDSSHLLCPQSASGRGADCCNCMGWQPGEISQADRPPAFTQVKPLLDAIGQGILDVGDSAKSGAAMKLVS